MIAVIFILFLTDSYGTSFVFPVPLCDQKESFHIVISPRDVNIIIVSILGRSFTRFAEIDFGKTETVSMLCTSPEEPKHLVQIPDGCIRLESSGEVAVSVLYRRDSYRVMPINLLSLIYYPTIFRGTNISENEAIYFLSVGAAYNNTTVNITESNTERGISKQLMSYDQVVYYTKEGATLIVISSMPVILLVGSFVKDSRKSTGGLLIEHDTPPINWGRFYALPLIQPMASVCIGLKAMKDAVTVQIAAKDGTTMQKLLSKDVLEKVCLVNMYGFLTVSATEAVFPVFVLKSLDEGKIVILHTVPPLERYLPSPCVVSMCYRKLALIIVAGLKSKRLDMSPYTSLKDYSTTEIVNSSLWVHIVNKTTLSSFSNVVTTVKTSVLPRPLWFFEMNLLKRDSQLWIVNSPSVIPANINELLCQTSNTSDGDQIDNDCDGLTDEEEANNKDDDNDSLIDEDLEGTEAANASTFVCQVYSIPESGGKSSVLHLLFRKTFKPNKENRRDLAFIICVSTALIGVIVFIGICFLLDYLEMNGMIKKYR